MKNPTGSTTKRTFRLNSSGASIPKNILIKFKTGAHVILEVRGWETDRDKAKRAYLDQWVTAVNNQGGFGKLG